MNRGTTVFASEVLVGVLLVGLDGDMSGFIGLGLVAGGGGGLVPDRWVA